MISRQCVFLLVVASAACGQRASMATPAPSRAAGILLENLTWVEAERVLTPETIVVIPLGAQTKEHGPQLQLRNDFTMAEYLTRRVMESSNVVVAPTVNYHFYPAFIEYPGSATLRLETARDMIVDIVRSLSRYGPRRFYVLNTGVSTVRALQPAVDILAKDSVPVTLRFTNIGKVAEDAEKSVKQEAGGTHADEIETSMMLYIAPETVDMRKAVDDYHPGTGRLNRQPGGTGTYSASGIFGNATLATREKGRVVVEAMVKGIVREIDELRNSPLP